jgi:molybdopterin-guanine dinucleotide biosynthesis protein A
MKRRAYVSVVDSQGALYDAAVMIDPKTDITGLVLAGGRGSRMGGVDKGLQPYQGLPLARHALNRLAPQVGSVMINANRNISVYEAMGVAVWPDELPDFPGPLAGMLAGLRHCRTSYLVTVPCDAPLFPAELVARLVTGLAQKDADIATAYTRDGDELFPQPVFCLMKVSLLERLRAFIASGERKTGAWPRSQHNAQVIFEDAAAFKNINTLDELGPKQPPR